MRIPYRVKETVENIKFSKYKKQKKINIIHESKIALIDMRSVVPDRRAVQIAVQLEEAGFDCFLYCPNYYTWMKAAFLHTWRYSEILFKKGIFAKIPDTTKLWVVGNIRNAIPNNSKHLIVNDSIMDNIEKYTEQNFFYPILMHPMKLNKGIESLCLKSNDVEKKIGILFVGNVNLQYTVHASSIHDRYNIHSRTEVIDYLKKQCEKYVYEPKSHEEFMKALRDEDLSDKIVIIDKFRLTDDYIDVLRTARCFLHVAGVEIPYCHNQIESAACGCIPITEFPYYFKKLNTQENCLSYESLKELELLCSSFCNEKKCNSPQLQDMSIKIKRWYIEQCGFDGFRDKINAFIDNGQKLSEEYYIFREISPILRKIEKITKFHF